MNQPTNRQTPPKEIRLNTAKNVLTVTWVGKSAELRAEYLRVESPSAEVKGHGLDQARLVSGKQAVTIANVEPVGAYALKIIFSDGHNTGLYTWSYLRELAEEEDQRWSSYITDLAAAGLGREKSGPMVRRMDLKK
jgi:DUF971 family protein